MAKEKLNFPDYYRSGLVTRLKEASGADQARDLGVEPIQLDLGRVCFKLPRRFGFCFGVQNAMGIAFNAIESNPNQRKFLLSEMIHNPAVNADLEQRGIVFLRDETGRELVPLAELRRDDVVIIPAFGATYEVSKDLERLGIETESSDTTCPFVKKVWKRGEALGEAGFSVVLHGKADHEETRATFSRVARRAPSIIVRDLAEAQILCEFISEERGLESFGDFFSGRCSDGFDPKKDLARIGVINQTTVLASETRELAELLKRAMVRRYGEASISEHFADTRDTLCYATLQNQQALLRLLEGGGDLALVIGGYNSSNTSHLAELCSQRMPTFHIKDAEEILGRDAIRHFDYKERRVQVSEGWLKEEPQGKLELLLAAGASSPDALIDRVICRVAELFGLEAELSLKFAELSANSGGVGH